MKNLFFVLPLFFLLSLNLYAREDAEIWKSVGYNYVLEITGNNFKIYNYTENSLLLLARGVIKDDTITLKKYNIGTLLNFFSKEYPYGKFERLNEQEAVIIRDIGYEIKFNRISELPSALYNKKTDNPIVNFNVLCSVIEENYSKFDYLERDWDNLKNEYQEQIKKDTGSNQLKSILSSMISELNDGHTSLAAGFDNFESQRPTPGYSLYFKNAKKIVANIKSRLQGIGRALDGQMGYGEIRDTNIGYMTLFSFDETDKAKIEEVLDSLMEKNSNMDGLIIDLRLNTGGEDYFALRVVSRFTDKKRQVITKQVRLGDIDEYSQLQKIYIEPTERQFLEKPIIVLTSNVTASAAEIAVLAFNELDNVTVIGEKTNGSFSDVLINILPIGWLFNTSNERYLSKDGENYEQIGIRPDLEIVLSEDDIKKGYDPVLEKAINIIEEGI